MSVGVLLVTHDDIGSSLVNTLHHMFGDQLPLKIAVLPISPDCEPLRLGYQTEKYCEELEDGDGVLVFTDIFGATPCNIACHLFNATINHQVRIIAGVNLPMLVKVMNYPQLTLPQLADYALQGGQQGVLDVAQLLS